MLTTYVASIWVKSKNNLLLCSVKWNKICMYALYHTVGFVCEVLIWANYASCHGLNSQVTLALSFQLTARVTILFLWFLYPTSLFKYFKRMDISALLPDPKGQRIGIVVCIMTTLQALLQCNSLKRPCRCSILWSQSLS